MSLFGDEFDAQATGVPARELMRQFKIPWKSQQIVTQCPHCKKSHWVSIDGFEDCLEDLIFSVYPELTDVREEMILTQDQYDTLRAILAIDSEPTKAKGSVKS